MSRPTRLAAYGVMAVVAGGLAVFVGHPIPICWTGVGTEDAAAIDRCLNDFVSALSPWDRLGYEHPLLAAGLLFVTVFAVLAVALELAVRVTSRRSVDT